MTIILVILAIYMVGMIGVGIYGRKYATTYKDSITAARNSGIIMIAGSA